MGKFEIFKDKRGEYRFRLKARNGEIILRSEGYTRKSNCENGIHSVKTHAPDNDMYVRGFSIDGLRYFNLKASNGQVIGTSETYSSTGAMETGIGSVKTNAPMAEVVDLTRKSLQSTS